MAVTLLAVLLLLSAAHVWRDRKDYVHFKTLEESAARRAVFARWILESFLLYGVSSVVVLALLGRLPSLQRFPAEFAQVTDSFRAWAEAGGFCGGSVNALIRLAPLLLVLQTVGALYRASRGSEEMREALEARDVFALFPRNARERRWTGLLSLNAGLSEELFFRLAAPLLVYEATGSVALGLVLATVWFGLMHAYQGWVGVLVTSVVGTILMAVYLLSGSLWIAVGVHALLDLNDLWIGPTFEDWLERRR
ncbi:MAG: CPBP family intramembrane glutamic endopeptidase [Acidobacteriota bacterium]